MNAPNIAEFLPEIDESKCIACELCVKICANEAMLMVNQLPVIARPEACTYTGACEEICPTGAIQLTYEIVFTNE